MRTFGDLITDQIVIAKILCNLTPQFYHTVVAIEEAKNFTTLSMMRLVGQYKLMKPCAIDLEKKLRKKPFKSEVKELEQENKRGILGKVVTEILIEGGPIFKGKVRMLSKEQLITTTNSIKEAYSAITPRSVDT